MFKKTCIIGCGLIGSSLARAIKKYNLSKDLILNPKTALILELKWKHKCEISIFL